jgi:prepilin-type N-terminal cleavage/methylation domain-containing protein
VSSVELNPRTENPLRISIRVQKQSGFTLIELLVVVSLIGLLISVSVPVSYNMYLSYQASLKAEEVFVYVSQVRRESFLYGDEVVLSSQEGLIRSNDGEPAKFPDVFVQIDEPIKFYKNGTTSGGIVKIRTAATAYRLTITAPFGELLLARES